MTKKPIDTNKYSEDELLALVEYAFGEAMCVQERKVEPQDLNQAYEQIVALIKKPVDYEKNLADCTEAIDILIEQHEELCEEREWLKKKPEVTEEWIEEKAEKLDEKLAELNPTLPTYSVLKIARDFIRSLVEEIKNG